MERPRHSAQSRAGGNTAGQKVPAMACGSHIEHANLLSLCRRSLNSLGTGVCMSPADYSFGIDAPFEPSIEIVEPVVFTDHRPAVGELVFNVVCGRSLLGDLFAGA